MAQRSALLVKISFSDAVLGKIVVDINSQNDSLVDGT
jgi:hypothetical protein